MLEQEIASIMKYTLEKAGNPTPYYDQVPESFFIPSVYFPVPEVSTTGDTLSTFALEYAMFVKFFDVSIVRCFAMTQRVLLAIRKDRNLVPLVDGNGAQIGRGVRLHDPSCRQVQHAESAIQLELRWDSRRAYDAPVHEKMSGFQLEMRSRNAFERARRQGR